MFYRLNLLIIRHICLCCIAENINVNENIFVEKLYSNYLYLYICEKNIRTYGITRVIRFATHSVRSHN